MKKIIKSLLVLIISTFYMFLNVFSLDFSFAGLSELLKTKIAIIHYYNGPNDAYQNSYGFMIVKGVKDLAGEDVTLNGETMKCYAKLQGYYVNLVRGGHFIPLSEEDRQSWINLLNGDGIDITGGLYTACDKLDVTSIVGQLNYTYDNGVSYGSLYAGFRYKLNSNDIVFSSGFINSFQLYGGTKPVGFIFDNVGGVGFVGGRFDVDNTTVSEIQTNIMDEITKDKGMDIVYNEGSMTVNGINVIIDDFYNIIKSYIGLKGMFNLSDSNFDNEQKKQLYIKQMFVDEQNRNGNTKQAYNIGVTKLSSVINSVKKRAYSLCAGRWKQISGGELTKNGGAGKIKVDKINCFDNDTFNSKLVIEFDLSTLGYNPIIIVKGEPIQVVIKKSMEDNGFVEIFVEKGYLLLSDDINTLPIGKDGQINYTNAVTSGTVLNGNFVINGLLGGYDTTSYQITGFAHKLYVNGSLASLNTISDPKEGRINYIKDLLENATLEEKNINLSKIFTWQCLDTGVGTDGVNCSNENDKWWQNSFIIQKQQYNGMLLK